MLLRPTVVDEPGDQPDNPGGAGDNKRATPRDERYQSWNHQRHGNVANIGSGVENARGQCAFTLREPLGNSS